MNWTNITTRTLDLDNVNPIQVFINEHSRQLSRVVRRRIKSSDKTDYSVTLRARLNAVWTVEIQQDMAAFHGIPIEQDLQVLGIP